jgi:hypothetical protein
MRQKHQIKSKVTTLQKVVNCECGKKFHHLSSLSRHKKICSYINNSENNKIDNNNNNNNNKDELIQYLINENKEFKNLILEIVKKDTTTNNK